jgi:diaminohydroxyphosphoribosylaminopyrimidine deaminase/5-amino-6-(5-phosphoribosylamino)uracil reductase
VVKDGAIVGEGWHKKAGTPHAEVNALAQAGERAKGADIYVTLEPCNHHGRTPPCTRAVLEAGIRRVVIGVLDPNPKVAGGGAAFLKQHGLQVDSGCLEAECQLLLAPFAKAVTRALPWIRQKTASSLDGRTATHKGHSKWITNERARGFGQRLREMSDAILIGRRTAEKDNPSLTFRKRGHNPPYKKRLWRVVLDSRLLLDPGLKIFQVSEQSPTIAVCTDSAPAGRIRRLADQGVQVLLTEQAPDGRVRIDQALRQLCKQGIHSVLVEGGAEIHGAFHDADLVDEGFHFFAPIIIGGSGARPAVAGRGAAELNQAHRLQNARIRRFGDNFLVTGTYTDPAKLWKG